MANVRSYSRKSKSGKVHRVSPHYRKNPVGTSKMKKITRTEPQKMNLKTSIQGDWMGSSEYNDEIGSAIRKIIGENHDVRVAYHEVSDGKHQVYIDEEEAFEITAWSAKAGLNSEVQYFIKHKDD